MTTDLTISNNHYLDLMKRILLNEIYEESEASLRIPPKGIKQFLFSLVADSDELLWRKRQIPKEQRDAGQVWPPSNMAHSMIGMKRLNNLQFCIEQVVKDNIPGDLIETGVWRGGATIFMAAALRAYGVTDRNVWVADSFQGLPPPKNEYPQDTGDIHHTISELAISLESVQENFSRYGLLNDQIKFLKGWFCDTLPNAPIEKISVMRLDGDMYESTMDALNTLYPKLSVGGFIIIDDYCLKPCAKAVEDYRAKHSITDNAIDIDGSGIYWRKS